MWTVDIRRVKVRGGTRPMRIDAHVAQSVEHFLGKEEVTGSNPVVGFQINLSGN
jgi:hypothetical protein